MATIDGWDDLDDYLARPDVQAEIAADEAGRIPGDGVGEDASGETEWVEPPGGYEAFEARRAELKAKFAAATAAAPPPPPPSGNQWGPPPPPPGWDGPKFELGRLLGSGIEILRYGAEVGVFTAGRPPAAFHRYAEMAGLMTEGDDWHAAARDDWMDYREFYYEQDKVIMAPMERVAPEAVADWLASRPEPITVEEGGLAISLAGASEHSLFYGPTNVGKSRAAIWTAAKSGLTTLYIATEQLEGAVRWAAGMGGVERITFASTPRDHREVNELAEAASEMEAELVVVDTIAQLVADENSASDYVSMLRYLAPLTEGRLALFIHHSGKEEARGPRGISKMVDTPPIIYRVRRGDHHNEIVIAQDKVKGDWDGRGGVLAVTPPEDRGGRWGVEARPLRKVDDAEIRLPMAAIEAAWIGEAGAVDEPLAWYRIKDSVVAPAVKDSAISARAAMEALCEGGHLVEAPRPEGKIKGRFFTFEAAPEGGGEWREPGDN